MSTKKCSICEKVVTLLVDIIIGGCYQNSKFTHRGGKILEPLEGANNSKLFLSIFQWP